MLNNRNSAINKFDNLIIENNFKEEINGMIFKKFSYNYTDYEGNNLVNIYLTEFNNLAGFKFGIEFSSEGDYCVDLTKRADNKVNKNLLASINCNFGLIVDEIDFEPKDISYNLHLDENRLYQLPVADKSSILINQEYQVELKILKACGKLKIDHKIFEWIGSMKKDIKDEELSSKLIVYNSFNQGLLQISDHVTKTKKILDSERSHTPNDPNRIDLIIENINKKLVVVKINKSTGTRLFLGNFIVSIPKTSENNIKIGSILENISIDNENLNKYKFGSTGGVLLTQDLKETHENIKLDRIIQTRSDSSKSAFQKNAKFCRSCVIQDRDSLVFMLIDGRKGKKGQEGVAIYKLRQIIQELYPTFINAVNVDGGHAPKLIIKKGAKYDVFGNLHYKIWPKNNFNEFIWNGYNGRKIPAILYAYK